MDLGCPLRVEADIRDPISMCARDVIAQIRFLQTPKGLLLKPAQCFHV
jgi:hypothetical protein